ncbi:MAG: carboxypeptidase-like regulatory domain-containing protein [Candidatus Riflebacteria bacterium]|nr:carboxypeptidase-like regulatory domain-containing protein [Candidatus Riflebacteria bacterium]
MKQNSHSFLSTLLMLVAFIGLSSQLNAAAKGVMPNTMAGHSFVKDQLTVMMLDGPCVYRSPQDQSWLPIEQGQSLRHNDSVRTGSHGYLILAWSANNMIMIKPSSAIRISLQSQKLPQLTLQLYSAEIMLSARDSGLIEITGRHGALVVNHGESSFISNTQHEIIRAVKGQAAFRLSGNAEATLIPENYSLKVNSDGSAMPLERFDPQSEYDSFRRFAQWLRRFDNLHRQVSQSIAYNIDSVRINDSFLNSMGQDENGFYIIETKNGQIPRQLHLQIKITPYPGPSERFELSLGKDLVYALREGRDGYHEVIFAPPSIPEILFSIHALDSLDRRISIFKAGISLENKRAKEQKARKFCKQLSDAFSRRDHIWLRNNISRDYRDWQGNTWFDFVNMSEETLRRYRDVRLTLQPFRFEVRDGMMLVHLNYRMSALTAEWNFRYEDRGSEVITLKPENGELRLYSKTAGMFFNRLKVAVDLRQGLLRGRVTDERTKRPLSGVSVTVRNTNYHATTDSMGEYVIYNMTPGTYDLRFFKNGYGELTATRITIKPSGEQF